MWNKLISIDFDYIWLLYFKSSPYRFDQDVPQRPILGFLLFTLEINNIYGPTQQRNVPFYADDTVLYAIDSITNQTSSRLQSASEDLQISSISLKLIRAQSFDVPTSCPQWWSSLK